jgi:hypothetical protein
MALTGAEWKTVGRRIARSNGLSAGAEFFAWMLDGAEPEKAAAVVAGLPSPLRLLYRAVWEPRYVKVRHW